MVREPSYPKLFTTNPAEVTDHPEADIVIEALGAQEESHLKDFKDYIIRAFQKGKSVVTSDKAVLARFGGEIRRSAESCGQELRFEACVGGGIPIIRSLTESFAAEEPEAIYGIVNGTCNYILSEMKGSGKSYEEALQQAQEHGYAETNPTSDTSGLDAEAKLILLASVTFGLQGNPGAIWRKGIEEIHLVDFLYADRKGGCTIKPLAVARNEGGAIEAFISPVLVPHSHFLASIDGVTNAIFFKGKRSGGDAGDKGRDWNYVFAGPGAGGAPTAVAIMGDICELARGGGRKNISHRLSAAGKAGLKSEDQISGRFYIRFVIKDRAGIVGDICQTFGRVGINVAEIWQLTHSQDELRSIARSCQLGQEPSKVLPFVITLERTTVGDVKKALGKISGKDYLLVDPVWLPIWSGE
jgi:homoserine dehydrogenase